MSAHVRSASWLVGMSVLSLCACSSLTDPGPGSIASKPAATVAAPAPTPTPREPAPPAAAEELISASHILIAFQGGMRAAPTVTRSKEEAKALAGKVLAEARKSDDFGALAVKYSDDPTAKTNRGNMPKFSRTQMVKPFSDAAFALKVQELSPTPVETPFGFHVIKRTE